MISDPELRARLALPEPAFVEYLLRWVGQLGPRDYTPGALAHALGYPWERPARSYVLSDKAVTLIDDLDARQRHVVLERFVAGLDHRERTPLLAIGSNGAPNVLRRKFAHFADPEDREVLVAAGHLHDFDVGPSAHVAAYGALPATLFPSPGAMARTAVLWLTERQFTQLAWTELSYSLGRLRTRFEADEPEFDACQVLAFVSRFGTFCPEGEPVALAAVPARARTAAGLSQGELLDAAGALALGPGCGPEELVRAVFANYAAAVPRILAAVRTHARRFTSPHWTPVVEAAG